VQRTAFGIMQTQVVCDQCDGTGEVIAEKCPDCKGQVGASEWVFEGGCFVGVFVGACVGASGWVFVGVLWVCLWGWLGGCLGAC
jgi:hypothetical protein